MRKKPILLDKEMLGGSMKIIIRLRHPPQRTPAAPRRTSKDYGEPLNFRVPPEFSQKFRLVAVRKRLKLHELLIRSFEVYLREEGDGSRGGEGRESLPAAVAILDRSSGPRCGRQPDVRGFVSSVSGGSVSSFSSTAWSAALRGAGDCTATPAVRRHPDRARPELPT